MPDLLPDPDEPVIPPRPDLSGNRVLLAEDNLINQEVAVELLQVVGLEVDVADDGYSAVARAAGSSYDLILMDVQMPSLDGLEATRRIRALPGHGETPILAMTANAFGEDREACLAAGMNDHIPKPVDPEQLYALLAHWLRQPDPPPRTAEPAASDPMQELAPITGLTFNRALMYLPGQTAVYRRVLRHFADAYRGGLLQLPALLASGERAAARVQVHALRGACGAIGALDVGALAQRFEAMLADGADSATLDAEQPPLQQALQAQVAAIDAALGG